LIVPPAKRGQFASMNAPTVMHHSTEATDGAHEGFLVLDFSMYPLFVNPAAAQILSYPQQPDAQEDLAAHVAGRMREAFLSEPLHAGPALLSRIQSGRRTYVCRSFQLSGMGNGASQASRAVLLERRARSASLLKVSEKFRLTAREHEVAQLLLQGLTSKEIGLRMQISPNTVKAFLRLMMVKMGVSTRSGILGKAFTAEL
jgi:DNA-binding CsgD family transcriptional regulator